MNYKYYVIDNYNNEVYQTNDDFFNNYLTDELYDLVKMNRDRPNVFLYLIEFTEKGELKFIFHQNGSKKEEEPIVIDAKQFRISESTYSSNCPYMMILGNQANTRIAVTLLNKEELKIIYDQIREALKDS